MTDHHGTPCWYELTTSDTKAAQAFYKKVVGWSWKSAEMPGFDYSLASSGKDMVAGMSAGDTPLWAIYIAVRDCDATTAAMAEGGAAIAVPPTDIPGTGRFAMLTDPQGALIGILQPLPGGAGGAFNQKKTGHGQWHELMTRDPEAAMAFYSHHFGWTRSRAMDMGPMGTYTIFAHKGTDIGGMMTLAPGMPGPGKPFWQPYFGVKSAAKTIEKITKAGGKVLHGPQEVPGGAFIVVATDPQGAVFATVGKA